MDFPIAVIASKALDAFRSLGRFVFAAPEVDVLPARTKFGWAGSGAMLVLTVRVRNQSAYPVFLKSLRIKHSGTWHSPSDFHFDRIRLDFQEGSHVIDGLVSEISAIDSPRIPPMEVVERFGVFRLPSLSERWPRQLSILWEVAFSRRRNRRGNYVVTERG